MAKRLANWDLLRTLAMLFVVIVHSSQYLGPVYGIETRPFISEFALICDPIFFVLSGYFAFRPLKTTYAEYLLNKVVTIIFTAGRLFSCPICVWMRCGHCYSRFSSVFQLVLQYPVWRLVVCSSTDSFSCAGSIFVYNVRSAQRFSVQIAHEGCCVVCTVGRSLHSSPMDLNAYGNRESQHPSWTAFWICTN